MTVPQNLAVADAIERDTAGHAELALLRLRGGIARDLQHDLFRDFLDARRQIEIALSEVRLRLARRAAEQAMKAPVRHRQPLRVVEIVEVHAERTVVADLDQMLADRI